MNRHSLPGDVEEIIDSVVVAVADDIEWMVDEVFMPDGRPFRQEKMTMDEQIEQYMQSGLRDNKDAALNWMRERVVMLTQKLSQYGIGPEEVANAHPWDIIQTAALKYSARMEREIRKREGQGIADPIAPFTQEVMADGVPR